MERAAREELLIFHSWPSPISFPAVFPLCWGVAGTQPIGKTTGNEIGPSLGWIYNVDNHCGLLWSRLPNVNPRTLSISPKVKEGKQIK